jgi:hypothetical protein
MKIVGALLLSITLVERHQLGQQLSAPSDHTKTAMPQTLEGICGIAL